VFVPPRQPRALAEALGDLLDNPELRDEMGERNRKKVEEWAPDRVIPRYVEIMASLVPGAATGRDQTP
jgi:glycosyltransferase involved in cell wall biosynthesis